MKIVGNITFLDYEETTILDDKLICQEINNYLTLFMVFFKNPPFLTSFFPITFLTFGCKPLPHCYKIARTYLIPVRN